MKRICAVGLFLIIACVPAYSQLKVLFDNTKAETAGQADWIIDTHQPVPSPAQSGITPSTPESYWVGGISAWGVNLVQQGYIVHTLTASYGITYGNGSNPYDLSNYAMFVVCEPNIRFTSAEKTAILNYVQNGGSLFMVSDHYGSDRNNDGWDSPMIWNDLGSDSLFGLHFEVKSESNNNVTGVFTNVSANPNDSVVHGPAGTATALSYHNGSTLNLLTTVNPNAAGHIWMNSIAQGTTQVVAATSRYGRGKIAAICDSSPADDGTGESGNSLYTGWTEAGATDNIVFMNMSLWLLGASSPPPPAPPAQVLLAAPASGSTSLTPPFILRWASDSGAAVYRLDVSTTPVFSFFTFTDSTLTDTQHTLTGLAPNVTYYWRVRAGNSAGWGSYSNGWNFTTLGLAPAPAPVSPPDGAGGEPIPVSLVWNSSAGASGYYLQISSSSDFSGIVFGDSTITDTSALFSGAAPGARYYWRVLAGDPMGWSTGNVVRSFTCWDVPRPVSLLQPADSASDVPVPVILSWNFPAGSQTKQVSARSARRILTVPVQFELDLARQPDFSAMVFADTTLTDTSLTFDSAQNGTTYYWRVRAKNQAGWGGFTAVRRFTTWDVPPAVMAVSPADSSLIFGDTIIFRWHAAHSAATYDFELSSSPGFSTTLNSDTSLTDTALAIGGFDTGLVYYWHVRAHDQLGWGNFGPAFQFRRTVAVTLYDTVSAGWALVSLPTVPVNPAKDSIFPGSVSGAYAYAGSYELSDSLGPGNGYWLKFGAAGSIAVSGVPVVRETVAVSAGWNLIGSVAAPLPAIALTSIPDSILTGALFGYSSNYIIADTLLPFRGYWVKTSRSGLLVLAADGGAPRAPRTTSLADLSAYRNLLTVTDRSGRAWNLRFSSSAAAVIDGPPAGYADPADVRFDGGSVARPVIPDAVVRLELKGLAYPVSLRWNTPEAGRTFALDLDGEILPMKPGGETVLNHAPVSVGLRNLTGGIPAAFTLDQNYPNPFNPSTTIRYGLPEASRVRVTVVNLLGQETAVLAAGVESAGYHEAVWNASQTASGVYFLRFEARPESGRGGGIVRVEKIVLAK